MAIATVNGVCSVTDAADIIGCSDRRVRQMLKAGELKGDKVTPGAWVVDIKDAERMSKVEHTRGARRGKRS